MISYFYLYLIKLNICTSALMFFPTLALDFLILMILIDSIEKIIRGILGLIDICNERKYKYKISDKIKNYENKDIAVLDKYLEHGVISKKEYNEQVVLRTKINKKEKK